MQIDVTYYVLVVLCWLGIVWDRRRSVDSSTAMGRGNSKALGERALAAARRHKRTQQPVKCVSVAMPHPFVWTWPIPLKKTGSIWL
jgi:hypothetical protein